MIDPIAIGLTKEYILKSDKENPTIWIIGAIDSITASKIIANLGRIEVTDEKPQYVLNNDIANNDFEIVKYGLKGVKNWSLNGQPVELVFEKELVSKTEVNIVTRESLSMIPLYAIHELAMEIWGSNNVKEDLGKK